MGAQATDTPTVAGRGGGKPVHGPKNIAKRAKPHGVTWPSGVAISSKGSHTWFSWGRPSRSHPRIFRGRPSRSHRGGSWGGPTRGKPSLPLHKPPCVCHASARRFGGHDRQPEQQTQQHTGKPCHTMAHHGRTCKKKAWLVGCIMIVCYTPDWWVRLNPCDINPTMAQDAVWTPPTSQTS